MLTWLKLAKLIDMSIKNRGQIYEANVALKSNLRPQGINFALIVLTKISLSAPPTLLRFYEVK